MRLLLALVMLAFALPAKAGRLHKDYKYEGGVPLDLSTMPKAGGRAAHWAEVERQSRACIALKKGNTIPCTLLWGEALNGQADYANGLIRVPGDFRKGGKPTGSLPEHFYADILPQLVEHAQFRFWYSNMFTDSGSVIIEVLMQAVQACDTPARCAAYEKKLDFALGLIPPKPTSYHPDHFDMYRLYVAVLAARAADTALSASLTYLRNPFAPPCTLCIETVAADFRRQRRIADADRLLRYGADIMARLPEAASHLEKRVHAENLLEGERLFLPPGHVRVFERNLELLTWEHSLTKAGVVVGRLRDLCHSTSQLYTVPVHYLEKLEASRKRCFRELAIALYNHAAESGDVPARREAHAIAGNLLSIYDRNEIDRADWWALDKDLVRVFIDGLADRDFDYAWSVVMKTYPEHQFRANLRVRHNRLDATARREFLHDAMCTLQRYECYASGIRAKDQQGRATDALLPEPVVFQPAAIDPSFIAERDLTFKRWVRVNWTLAHGAGVARGTAN